MADPARLLRMHRFGDELAPLFIDGVVATLE
jgi:hypothetical protein